MAFLKITEKAREKAGDLFLDIGKFIFTGAVLIELYKGLVEISGGLGFFVAVFCALLCFGVGIILFNKEDRQGGKK
ncbi:MAG: hypothetical protein FWE23_08370 [Chitinivibrionia bacterium]|nr:hypothetical protein [Chitinivibrionia bacterium]